jgi:hypothetical protein
MVDDDISGFVKFETPEPGKNKAVRLSTSDFMVQFCKWLTLADEKGYHLVGLSPTGNARFFDPTKKARIGVFVVSSFVAIKKCDRLRFDESLRSKADYDISAQATTTGLGVLRVEELHAIYDYGKKQGGMQTYRNLALHIESSNYLMKKWPGMFRPGKHPGEVVMMANRKEKKK